MFKINFAYVCKKLMSRLMLSPVKIYIYKTLKLLQGVAREDSHELKGSDRLNEGLIWIELS